MTNFARAAAGVAIVAIVGVGVLAWISRPAGVGPGNTPAPTVTAAPPATPAPTSATAGRTTYTSEVHGFTLGVPEDWSLHSAATRGWQAGDAFGADDVTYADVFVSPEEATVGLFVWEMPAGDGADLDSVQGLTAWAQTFCDVIVEASCGEFTQGAAPMCLDAGGDSCRPAILVPTADQQYAFFMDWSSAMFTDVPNLVRVVVVAREDGFPSAARYGGSVELLRSILTTMDVHPR